MTKDKNTINN